MAGVRPLEVKELRQWMDAGRPFALLDVLPAEIFEESRLPGALNACIYEITFLDQVAALLPDRKAPVVVYCAGPGSRASADAAERLAGVGYEEIFRLEGGREEWARAGLPFEGRPYEPPRDERPPDGEYALDVGRSVIGWVGRNPGGSHDGTLRFRSGRIVVKEGHVASGSFEVDMGSIEVSDLSGDLSDLLKRHLESEDFFAVERHPVARLDLTRMTPIANATVGSPNYDAEGKLTLRGVTQPVAFRATTAVRNGKELTLEAHFDLDRTRWQVNYGSGKLYASLGMHLVNDHFSVQIRAVASQVNR
jgi:polyisoprenoid-binding protein YceI/rhodanese-related sulfurtransferase